MSENNIIVFHLGNSPGAEILNKLSAGGFTSSTASGLEEARGMILSQRPAVCACIAPGPSDLFTDLLAFIVQRNLATKIIVSVAEGCVEDAVRFMQAGAHDFIISDRQGIRLIESVMRTVTRYRQTLPEPPESGGQSDTDVNSALVGQSPAICEIRSAVSMVAKSQTTVLITGESGTGKEVVANLIHRQSPRNASPYVTINCAAIPRDVIENELFGHERGAFTGALGKKIGCFEIADGGSLLFDEIAEMSLDTQAKLLRAIETQKFRRLGGKDEVHVDVRMIAATNRNITEALKEGELREDLYYRLSVIELNIPPVRQRQEDIPLLMEYFFGLFAGRYAKQRQCFSEEAMEILMAYEWPGNVREIRNVIERAIVICPNELIAAQYLPERITTRPAGHPHIQIPIGFSTQQAEKLLILETLASAGYNKAKAAKILGVSRKTLHNKLSGFQNPG